MFFSFIHRSEVVVLSGDVWDVKWINRGVNAQGQCCVNLVCA